MADETSPSTNTDGFTAASKSKFSGITNFVEQHWWIILIVVGVVAYLLYQRAQSSTAQVGSAAVGATDLTGGTVSPTQPDMSNLIDMLSTQYQGLTNQLSAWTQSTTAHAVAGSAPATPATVHATAKSPTPKAVAPTSANSIPQSQSITAPAIVPAPKPAPVFAPARIAAKYPVYNPPAIVTQTANPVRTFNPLRGRSTGNLAIGGVPPSGRVPFGTHVARHDPLMSTGTMRL